MLIMFQIRITWCRTKIISSHVTSSYIIPRTSTWQTQLPRWPSRRLITLSINKFNDWQDLPRRICYSSTFVTHKPNFLSVRENTGTKRIRENLSVLCAAADRLFHFFIEPLQIRFCASPDHSRAWPRFEILWEIEQSWVCCSQPAGLKLVSYLSERK